MQVEGDDCNHLAEIAIPKKALNLKSDILLAVCAPQLKNPLRSYYM